jgi:hypothetical protein
MLFSEPGCGSSHTAIMRRRKKSKFDQRYEITDVISADMEKLHQLIYCLKSFFQIISKSSLKYASKSIPPKAVISMLCKVLHLIHAMKLRGVFEVSAKH